MSFANIIKTIESHTGYRISYDDEVNNRLKEKKYTVNFQSVELKEVIKYLIKDETNLFYRFKNKSVFILSSSNQNIELDSIPRVINGIVRDNSGNAIPGATIHIKNSSKGTTTDNLGKFNLPDIPQGSKIIISSIGYQTKELTASTHTINAELNPFVNNLNETQVIAYGSTTKKNNTGNVTTIKASEIQGLPVSNPLISLQGRVSGLDLRPANGLPGAGISMRIQGNNSLTNGNDPLIIIDGIPYPSQYPKNTQYITGIMGDNGGLPGQYGSPLSFLNTNDIESISVLKGADATSIYGSRAANGAILITTKKGKVGKISVTLDIQSGIKRVGRKLNLMSGAEYLSMRREAIKNDGSTPGLSDYDLNGTWDTTISHDWQKELFGHTAQNSQTSLSVSGGSENVQYRLAGTYLSEGSVFPENFNKPYSKQGTGTFSIVSTSLNKRLYINFNTSYTYNRQLVSPSDFVSMALNLAPVAPNISDINGNINWSPNASGIETWRNPIASNLTPYKTEGKTLVSNMNVSYELLPNLKIASNFGYNSLDFSEKMPTPNSSMSPLFKLLSFPNMLLLQQRSNSTWNIEPQLNYTKQLKDHNIELLVGTTITNIKSTSFGFRAQKFSSDLLIEDIASAAEITGASSDDVLYKYNAVFGRIFYSYKQKYLLQLTGRRDGSSRFGDNNRFHSFGSIGGAWIFSDEPGVQERLPFLSYGKIRSSYGTSGNDQIGDYNYLTLYRTVGSNRAYQGLPGVIPYNLPNPNLQWEEVKKWELGLEVGLLQNRILLNTNYSINSSSNQLIAYSLPSTTGFNSIFKNQIAKIRNSAFELSLSTVNVKTNNLTWSTSIVLTLPKSKLIEFPNLDQSSYYFKYTIGQSPNIVKVYKSAGVNDTTGKFQFYDTKGNITINPDDVTTSISLDPKFYGSISNNFNFKNFNLTIYFTYDKRNIAIAYPQGQPGRFNYNAPKYMLDRWQKPGDNSTYQRYSADYSISSQYNAYTIGSDKAYENTFYLRCSNISLSWELPNSWKNTLKMDQGSIYLQIANPFVISNEKYMLDPQYANQLPLLKTYNLGFRTRF